MCKMYMLCKKIKNKYILINIFCLTSVYIILLTLLFNVHLVCYPRMATVLIILKVGFLNIKVPVFVII